MLEPSNFKIIDISHKSNYHVSSQLSCEEICLPLQCKDILPSTLLEEQLANNICSSVESVLNANEGIATF